MKKEAILPDMLIYYLDGREFAAAVEHAAITVRKATDAAGLRVLVRPDLMRLATELRGALERAIGGKIIVRDWDKLVEPRHPPFDNIMSGGSNA